MNLESLGADSRVRDAFQPYAAQGLILARVAVSHRDQYRLYSESGELFAEPSGGLWYRSPDRASMPVTGDWVAARIVGPGEAIVESVLPRATCFSRRAAGKREDQQPVAVNIDLVFLVCGLDRDFNLRRLERYLALAAESGASPVVVLNKADLCADLSVKLEQTAAIARDAPIVTTSACSASGIEPLLPFLVPGRTVALMGSSGVGKSTIVNSLAGQELLRTSAVRESDGRGQHSTTHRELILLPLGGVLIDTPGMRELQLWARRDSVDAAFSDIASAASECRYRDCTHTSEPGCAVNAAVSRGFLEPGRLESYHKLSREAERHEALLNPHLALERKRKLKQMHKAARSLYKSRSGR